MTAIYCPVCSGLISGLSDTTVVRLCNCKKINTKGYLGPWICPRCDTVNAPFKDQCNCSPTNLNSNL